MTEDLAREILTSFKSIGLGVGAEIGELAAHAGIDAAVAKGWVRRVTWADGSRMIRLTEEGEKELNRRRSEDTKTVERSLGGHPG